MSSYYLVRRLASNASATIELLSPVWTLICAPCKNERLESDLGPLTAGPVAALIVPPNFRLELSPCVGEREICVFSLPCGKPHIREAHWSRPPMRIAIPFEIYLEILSSLPAKRSASVSNANPNLAPWLSAAFINARDRLGPPQITLLERNWRELERLEAQIVDAVNASNEQPEIPTWKTSRPVLARFMRSIGISPRQYAFDYSIRSKLARWGDQPEKLKALCSLAMSGADPRRSPNVQTRVATA
jgi:hypothetical protein